MKILGIIDEDFVNYKKLSMTIMFPFCSFKCGNDYCQNSSLINEPIIDISYEALIKRYISNPITDAIVFQGLEPFDSWEDIEKLIYKLRIIYNCNDDIVIYTGYNKEEIEDKIKILSHFPNVIVKYGRYIHNDKSHYDEVLGVKLASNNQYAEKIS